MARQVGTPNRDKAELRALIQERVLEFTELRHKADLDDGLTPAEAQQIVEDYDPVVQMALVAVDRRVKLDVQLRAASEVAQYVRPKLKSVEVTTDADTQEAISKRQELSSQLIALLDGKLLEKFMADEERHMDEGEDKPE